jgi:Tol biopolymer transport system component
VFVTNVETGETRDVTPGDFDAPQHFYEDNAIAFSPDGRTLAFVSNRDGKDGEMSSTNRDVWLVPVTGGALRKLTPNRAADEQPVFSPDGKSVVTRSQRRAGFESDRWYLDVHDVAAGTKRTVFTTPDLSVDDFRFSPDGQTIWFLGAEKGLHNLYSVPLAGGVPKLIAKGGSISQFAPGNGFAVFAKSSLTAPADIHRVGAEAAARSS